MPALGISDMMGGNPPLHQMTRRVFSVFGTDPFRIGGNEAFARELSRQLGELGWESTLCFLAPPPEPVRRFLELPNVSLEVLEDSWKLRWRPARDLARILRRHKPQILHLHFTGFLGPYPWTARLTGVEKVFLTDQTSRPESFVPARAARWKRLAARAVNRPLDAVIAVSDYGRRCLASQDLFPEQRIHRIYNSVDFTRRVADADAGARFRRKHGIPLDSLLVAQVSWIRPEKGIADLLEVARLVVEQNPRAHFAIVGEGEHRERYTEESARMGLSDHVTWTGLVVDPLAEGVYAAAEAVCQLSRWEEVFGWVIAEAMQTGKPVVATRAGGIPELVQDGESGFLVERGDHVGAAEKILLLLSDAEQRAWMGCVGRRKAERDFDLRTNVAALLALYGLG